MVPSFLSRLAAMRRTPMREVAQNMGVSLRRRLDGVAHWGGLTARDSDALKLWSGVPIGEARNCFLSVRLAAVLPIYGCAKAKWIRFHLWPRFWKRKL